MRTTLILISLVSLAGCKGDPPTSPSTDDGGMEPAPDTGTGPDAPPVDPPTQVTPCGLLGLPGPPSTAVVSGPVRLRDIDGDGKLDLIAASATLVSVSPGRGDTSFGARIDSTVPDPESILRMSSLDVADLDGDGKLDLVLGRDGLEGTSVKIMLGDGTGRFQPGTRYPTDALSAVAVADLDGDGKPDLILAGGSAKVRLGHGDGTFGDETAVTADVGANTVAVGDIDGDGIPDVIVGSNLNAGVSVLGGKGDGTFKAAIDHDTASSTVQIAAADLNGDGKLDLVVQDRADHVEVLMNDGGGVLGAHVDYANPRGNYLFDLLAVGDINHDGKPDVVTNDSSVLVVFAGNGDGTLLPGVARDTLVGQSSLALGDVSGDDVLDVVLANQADSMLTVLQSDGSGGLISATPYVMGPVSVDASAADLDGDGYTDLILSASTSVRIALGKPGGEFQDPVDYPGSGTVRVQDLNKDGKLDLFVATRTTISVRFGNGDGTFRDRVDTQLPVGTSFVLGDLDGDGKADVVTDLAAADNAVVRYAGNSDGTFRNASVIWPLGRLRHLISLGLGDVNGDSRLDLFIADGATCAECVLPPARFNAVLLLNNSDGTVQPAFESTEAMGSVLLVDLDRDGKLDLITSATGVTVRRGNGDGTLQPAVRYPGAVGALQAADITGDGKLDVVTSSASGVASVWPGNGDGTLQPIMSYGDPVHGRIAIADIDRDGRLDIVTPGPTSSGHTFDVLFARCVR